MARPGSTCLLGVCFGPYVFFICWVGNRLLRISITRVNCVKLTHVSEQRTRAACVKQVWCSNCTIWTRLTNNNDFSISEPLFPPVAGVSALPAGSKWSSWMMPRTLSMTKRLLSPGSTTREGGTGIGPRALALVSSICQGSMGLVSRRSSICQCSMGMKPLLNHGSITREGGTGIGLRALELVSSICQGSRVWCCLLYTSPSPRD